MIQNHKLLALCFFILTATVLSAQRPITSPPRDTSKKKVTIDFADTLDLIQENGKLIQKLLGNVELRQDSIYMYCDSAIITNSNQVLAEGNVIIQQGDSLNVFSDSLNYDGDKKTASLFSDVVLDSKGQRLFTEQLDYDLNTKIATYFTGALLTNGITQLTSKRGYFYTDINEAFFKDSVVVIDPEFNLLSDTLKFNTKTQVAYFLGPTLITNDSTRIYCEDGFYDTQNELAEFRKNAQYTKGEEQAVGDVIQYDGATDTYSLIGNASFRENTRKAIADTIQYNEITGETFMLGNAIYEDSTQYISARQIIYNSKTETYRTRGRSYISDPPQILEANEVDYDSETGLGLAIGHVIWRDTSEQLTIVADLVEYNQTTDYLKASGGRPMLITVIEGDSLYMASDTLVAVSRQDTTFAINITDTLSIQNQQDTTLTTTDLDSTFILKKNKTVLPKDSLNFILASPTVDSISIKNELDTNLFINPLDSLFDLYRPDSLAITTRGDFEKIKKKELPKSISKVDTSRYLYAYPDVRIYKSNLQALSDSLVYSTRDSIFRFFKNPIIWSDTSQFTADTIHLTLKDDKIDRILLYNKSFIINSADELFFNQIKGKNTTAFFVESELRRMEVRGNAESVYYALDEERAYVGVNKTVSSYMMLYFGNNEIDKIKFYRQPTARLEQMTTADHDALKLEGFRWVTEGRPRSVEDVLLIKPKRSVPKVEIERSQDAEIEGEEDVLEEKEERN